MGMSLGINRGMALNNTGGAKAFNPLTDISVAKYVLIDPSAPETNFTSADWTGAAELGDAVLSFYNRFALDDTEGDEALWNAQFETSLDQWSNVGNGATWDNGQAVIQSTASQADGIEQMIFRPNEGTWTIRVLSDQVVGVIVGTTQGASDLLTSTATTANVPFEATFTTTAGYTGNVWVRVSRFSAATDIRVSYVSVKRTTASRHFLTSVGAVLGQDDRGKTYLEFDGATTRYVAQMVDLYKTDNVTIMAAVSRLAKDGSDAEQVICEASFNIADYNGAFSLRGNSSTGTAVAPRGFSFAAKGTTLRTIERADGYAPPAKNLLVAEVDISADTMTLEIDGTEVASGSSDLGAGQFGAHPIYIGRRQTVTSPDDYFSGRLYALSITAKLPADEKQKLAVWMARKGGLLPDTDNIMVALPESGGASESQLTAARNDLIDRVWSGGAFPTAGATSITTSITDPLIALGSSPSNLLRCDQMTIEVRDNSANLLDTLNFYVWHPTVATSNGKGVINVGGHISLPDLYAIGGGRDTIITELVEEGYTVVGAHMPYADSNSGTMVANHNALPDPTGTLNHMRAFVEGPIRAANELSDVTAWGINGLSGGGWTASVVAAIDPRFHGHCHAGMWPLFIFDGSRDWEQFLPGIFPDYDYTDLLYLATSGGRKFLHTYATTDTCCFTQAQYDTRPYGPRMVSIAASSGGEYELVTITDNQHRWQDAARAESIAFFNERL
jgi:hypothetical protein